MCFLYKVILSFINILEDVPTRCPTKLKKTFFFNKSALFQLLNFAVFSLIPFTLLLLDLLSQHGISLMYC